MLRRIAAQLRETGGHDPERHAPNQERDNDHQSCEGPQQTARRQARGAHHHKFAIPIEFVESEQNRGKKRDGRDDHDQRRDNKAGCEEKNEEGLALGGQQIEILQRLRHPDHARERAQRAQEGQARHAENISINQ